jgi:hypothetical protein
MKRLLWTLSILVISVNLLSQTHVISGKVVDRQTGEPLAGASVKHIASGLEAITDFDGIFSITSVEPGITELKVSYVSYQEVKMNRVIVKEGEPTELNIKMRRAEGQLPQSSFTASQSGNAPLS